MKAPALYSLLPLRRSALRARLLALAVLTAAALVLPSGALSPVGPAAVAAACTPGVAPDFNGDGIRDVVIGDPEATVEGHAGAGLVRVVLGGDKGTSEISQSLSAMTANPEAGDKFGYSLTVYDHNGDGCTDLSVGAPYEDVTTADGPQEDAGGVYVIMGTPSGIGAGSTVVSYTQKGLDTTTATEAGDLFGYSLAADETPAGNQFLVVGVPGEDIGTVSDAGCIHFVKSGTATTANQNDPGVPGDAEANDRFGAAVAAIGRYFVVGNPGEAIGSQAFAGSVTIFDNTITGGYPTAIGVVDEDQAPLTSGTAESGDRFGTAVSLTAYRPAAASSATHALLAIGAPNEDVGSVQDGGAVTTVHVEPDGTVREVNLIDRLSPDVEGDPLVSEGFGQRVVIRNTATGEVGSAATVKLAVTVPNQDVGAAENAGAVQFFPGLGPPGASDRLLFRGDGLVPGTAGAREFAGLGLGGHSSALYLGVPYSKGTDATRGVVYRLPWSAVESGAGTVTTYQPGAGGLPDTGTAFGSTIR